MGHDAVGTAGSTDEARTPPVSGPIVDLRPLRGGGERHGTTPVIGARVFPEDPGPFDRQVALADLARFALEGAGRGLLPEEAAGRLLLNEAVRLVHDALDAEVCAIFEYAPEPGGGLRVAATFPAHPTVPPAASPGDPSGRSLAVTIEGPPAVGVLAVHLGGERRFDAEEAGFVAEVADVVAMALRRLAGDEHQRRAALHDALTGLPNRALILDHLRRALARAERQPSPVAVLFIDLARFKVVNDTLGHDAGDMLLVAVAERLLGVLRPSDTLGRLGGDEFLVVCEDLAGEAEALAVAGRLAAAFTRPFALGGLEVYTGASIGVAVSKSGAELGALVAEADAAMYHSKRVGGSAPVLFRETIRTDAVATMPLGDGPASPGAPPVGGHLGDLVLRLTGMLEDVGSSGSTG